MLFVLINYNEIDRLQVEKAVSEEIVLWMLEVEELMFNCTAAFKSWVISVWNVWKMWNISRFVEKLMLNYTAGFNLFEAASEENERTVEGTTLRAKLHCCLKFVLKQLMEYEEL